MLTAGNVNDCTAFTQVLAAIGVPRPGKGRPRTTPERVIADKAYSSAAIRRHLRRRGIKATIPQRLDQQANRTRRGRHGGRPPTFNHQIYRQRNTIERCFNRLKHWRAIATRYDKLAHHYQAAITLVSALLWINQDPPDTT
jgi:transposase